MRALTKTTDETDLQVDVSFWLGVLIAVLVLSAVSALLALNVLLWKGALHA